MAQIILVSWREGLKKVSLSQLQMNILGKSLKEAKTNVDLVLEGKAVIIEIDDIDLANTFVKEAEKIGVNCELLVD